MASTYYVYAYIDPHTSIPFYIGYGHGTRSIDHLNEAKSRTNRVPTNPHKINKIKQLINTGVEPIIRIIDDNLTKQTAKELEVFLIEFVGRRVDGTGPLTNLTGGGDGGDTLSKHPRKREIFENSKKTRVGKHWWTNGTDAQYSTHPPADDYYRGVPEWRKTIARQNRLKGSIVQSQKHWINNGAVEKMVPKSDLLEPGWVVGRMLTLDDKRPNPKGKNWFNNGVRDYFLHKDDPRASSLTLGRLRCKGSNNPNFKPR